MEGLQPGLILNQHGFGTVEGPGAQQTFEEVAEIQARSLVVFPACSEVPQGKVMAWRGRSQRRSQCRAVGTVPTAVPVLGLQVRVTRQGAPPLLSIFLVLQHIPGIAVSPSGGARPSLQNRAGGQFGGPELLAAVVETEGEGQPPQDLKAASQVAQHQAVAYNQRAVSWCRQCPQLMGVPGGRHKAQQP